jgi:hypothetical protein
MLQFLIGTSLFFVVLTAVMTYPQVWHMADAVSDRGDPFLNLWTLSWIAHQLPIAPARLFDANMFFPEHYTLAYSETLLAPAVFATPLLWLGVNRILVYNIIMAAGFIASGVGAALLVRELTRNVGASIVAGVAFSFLPFRFDHYPQLQLQHAEWIPLSLWALHCLMRRGRLADGLRLGVFVTAQLLSCMYYGVYLASYLLIVGGALMLSTPTIWRTRWRALAAGIALSGVLFAPAATAYVGARRAVGERSREEIYAGSATWRNYLAAPQSSRLYGWSAQRFGAHERRLFPGVMVVVLAIVAMWPPWSAIRVAYALGLAFAVDLTLGFNGLTYEFLYHHVLPFHALRIPALATILVGFSLAVLAGHGVARVLDCVKSSRARVALTVMFCVIVLGEGCSVPVTLTSVPQYPPLIYEDLLRDKADSPRAVLVELPVAREDPTFMYYSTFHWQTLVNGYSGFFPESFVRIGKSLLDFPSATALDALRTRGVRYVLLHGELLEPREYQRIARAVAECGCGLALVARRPWQGSEISLYRVEIRFE